LEPRVVATANAVCPVRKQVDFKSKAH